MLTVGAGPAWSATDVVVADETLVQEIVDGVNTVRMAAGEAAVARDAALQTAAQAHAEYLVANWSLWQDASFSAHREVPGLPGFTAIYPAERVIAAGYGHEPFGENVLRLQTSTPTGASPWTGEAVVSSWVDPPLHRRTVLERSVLHVGVGYASDGVHHAYVLEAGEDHDLSLSESAVQPYPADGQTGVPTAWYENENPDPFPDLEGEVGYPLTVFPVHGGAGFVSAQLTLTRVGDGVLVPVSQSPGPSNYAFAAREPLSPGTQYHAAFFYTMVNEYDQSRSSGVLTWEFTTLGAQPPTTTTTQPPTTTTTVQPPTTTTTLSPPTTTTTTTLSPPTTVTPATFADVSTAHPYHAAISDMAARGVIQGSFDGEGRRVFKPDEPVVRQQFAKMIVETLGLPVGDGSSCPFGDVDPGVYPAGYVSAAAASGITFGTSLSPPRFSPWRRISRAQVMTMIVRAALSHPARALVEAPPDFAGILPSSDPTHGHSIRLAESNGLLLGISLQSWDVWSDASRGEVAQMLSNLARIWAEG